MPVRFDDSLPVAAAYIRHRFGEEAVTSCVFVRDASGRLSVLLDQDVTSEALAFASEELRIKLGGYGRGSATIRDATFPGISSILDEASSVSPVTLNGYKTRLIDRRIVGADWTARPIQSSTQALPRVVFASLKGGVGRSTALAVVSAHLSATGKRVLAIDLDLEAPGIGSTLLRPDETPEFGVLDYLVENNLSGTDAEFLQQCVGGSSIGSLGARVDVMPALGSRTLANPANALSKLGRVYIEDISEQGERLSFSEQVARMLEAYEATGRYDVVLIDARSGLHESNAAVLQNIDANVLLFASDQPQTYVGYSLLLAHLSAVGPVEAGWFDRFQFVHAKSSNDEHQQRLTEERLRQLLSYTSNDGTEAAHPNDQKLTVDDFALDWADDVADDEINDDMIDAAEVLRVLNDPRFEGFDPLSRNELLTPELYEGTFGSLLGFIDTLLIKEGGEGLDD